MKYNYLGQELSNIRLALLNSEYGYVDEENIPHINWGSEDDICDKNGFDKTYRWSNNSDTYIIEDYIIPKGTILCRYGFPGGRFTTLKGSAYETLGLPYIKETIEYHEYKVSKDICVKCLVTKGKVAPKFSSQGGAIQFMHKQPITLECEDGYLQEDMSWLQNYT